MFLFTLLAAVSLLSATLSAPVRPRRNLIFMISDGLGVSSETLAREFVRSENGTAHGWISALDGLLVGSTRTTSSSSPVTDSAAAATAFACGMKTFNGAVGITAERKPCGTVLEAAKAKGYRTGLITTARITHATPAAFAAHAVSREMEELIALQEIGNNTLNNKVDLLFGGGKCLFLPQADPKSCRSDDIDVWSIARSNGYAQISNRTGLDSLDARITELPLMGLFANGHMSYEIDRNPGQEPSLVEMVTKGLDVLNTNSQNGPGFFVMIEGARIDMAAHNNDPATHMRDIIAYWETVAAVQRFIDMHPDTAMISTSDHETGGMTLGVDPKYVWYPQALAPVKRSAASICTDIKRVPVEMRMDYVSNVVFPRFMGIDDATQQEKLAIVKGSSMSVSMCHRFVGQAVSTRARIGWTTGGHTGGDVGLYSYGAGTSDLQGSYENVQINDYMVKYLGVDMVSVTQRLANETIQQSSFYEHPLID